MIKLIIIGYYSKPDASGNCYWVSKIIAVKDRYSVTIQTWHCSNTIQDCIDLLGISNQEIYTMQMPVGIRQFFKYYHNVAIPIKETAETINSFKDHI